MSSIFIIDYMDSMYCEDNRIWPIAFTTEQEANAAIKDEASRWPSHNHHSAEWRYTVTEIYIGERDD